MELEHADGQPAFGGQDEASVFMLLAQVDDRIVDVETLVQKARLR